MTSQKSPMPRSESVHGLFPKRDLPEFLSPSVAAERLSVTWQDLSRWHKYRWCPSCGTNDCTQSPVHPDAQAGFGPERFHDEDGPFYRLVDIERWEDESGWIDLKRCYLMSDPQVQLNEMRMRFRRILVDIQGWCAECGTNDCKQSPVHPTARAGVPKRWKNTQEQWIHTHGDVRRYLARKGLK